MRETIGLLRRTLARLEVSSRTLFALIERGSCFAGTLLELALAADRSYMLASTDGAAPCVAVGEVNFGLYPPVGGPSRLENRFYGEPEPLAALRAAAGKPLDAAEALELGLVTSAPDDIDWAGRDPHRARGARVAVARRADGHGSEPALRQARRWRRGSSAV